MRWGKKEGEGFSYLEIVLALIILACIVIAFTQLFLKSFISVKNTEFQTLAHIYASDYMEDISHMDYVLVSTGTWAVESKALGQKGKVFTRQATVSKLSSDLKQIQVQVNWTDISGTKSIVLTSLVANYE